MKQFNLFNSNIDSKTCNKLSAEMKRKNTCFRYIIISKKVNEYYAQRIDGIRLDYDAVIQKVAADFGFSTKTIKRALKTA